MDRFRVKMDIHYEHVQRGEWEERLRQGTITEQTFDARRALTHRVFHRVLEAHTHERYETFELPECLKNLLRTPRDERSVEKASQLREMLIDASEKMETLEIFHPQEATEICAAVSDTPPWVFTEPCPWPAPAWDVGAVLDVPFADNVEETASTKRQR